MHIGSRVARLCNNHTMTDNGGKAPDDNQEAVQADCQMAESCIIESSVEVNVYYCNCSADIC